MYLPRGRNDGCDRMTALNVLVRDAHTRRIIVKNFEHVLLDFYFCRLSFFS